MTKLCRYGNHELDARTQHAGGEVCFTCATEGPPQYVVYELRVTLYSACDENGKPIYSAAEAAAQIDKLLADKCALDPDASEVLSEKELWS
jgi:hypothetical protein